MNVANNTISANVFFREVGRLCGADYQFWQYGNHAEEIYSHKFMWLKLDYIHLNPVRSGIVRKSSEYKYSSASNYSEEIDSVLPVTLISNPVVDVLQPSTILKYIK